MHFVNKFTVALVAALAANGEANHQGLHARHNVQARGSPSEVPPSNPGPTSSPSTGAEASSIPDSVPSGPASTSVVFVTPTPLYSATPSALPTEISREVSSAVPSGTPNAVPSAVLGGTLNDTLSAPLGRLPGANFDKSPEGNVVVGESGSSSSASRVSSPSGVTSLPLSHVASVSPSVGVSDVAITYTESAGTLTRVVTTTIQSTITDYITVTAAPSVAPLAPNNIEAAKVDEEITTLHSTTTIYVHPTHSVIAGSGAGAADSKCACQPSTVTVTATERVTVTAAPTSGINKLNSNDGLIAGNNDNGEDAQATASSGSLTHSRLPHRSKDPLPSPSEYTTVTASSDSLTHSRLPHRSKDPHPSHSGSTTATASSSRTVGSLPHRSKDPLTSPSGFTTVSLTVSSSSLADPSSSLPAPASSNPPLPGQGNSIFGGHVPGGYQPT